MAAAMMRARSHWRARRASLVVLTVLVGIVGATVLTSVAGARRTRSSTDRLVEATRSPDVFVLLSTESPESVSAIVGLPEVTVGDRMVTVLAAPPEGYLPMLASVDGRVGRDLGRDRVLRGRLPDPAAAHEVTLSEPLARRLGLDVGGRLPMVAPTREEGRCVIGADVDPVRCAGVQEKLAREDPAAFEGPRFDLEVVGITRGVTDLVERPDDPGIVVLTPAFHATYRGRVASRAAAIVRLRDGVTVEEFEAAVRDVVPDETILDIGADRAVEDAARSTVGVLANGLLVFGAVALVTGLAALVLALARHVSSAAADGPVLRALGATRRDRVVDPVWSLLPVAVGGGALSVAGAYVASGWMPIGLARRAEPDPGLAFDAAVLVAGGVTVAAVVVLLGVLVGRLRTRPGDKTAARVLARLPLVGPVPAAVGTRFALDPGSGERATPVRSAVAGVALAVAGVTAAHMFGAGLHRLVDEPVRYGYGWDLGLAADVSPSDVAADPAVAGVSHVWLGFRARVQGESVTAFTAEPYAGAGPSFVIVAGRPPVAPDEVALGAKTMRHARVGLGDRVDVEGRPLRVVGRAVYPVTDDGYPLADGVLLHPETFSELGLAAGDEDIGYDMLAVDLVDGADHDAAVARLGELGGGEAPSFPRVPAEVDQLQQLNRLPLVLAVFLFVVALLAVGHVLLSTVGRRTADLAVLRVLGCTPGQTRRTVLWQATILAAAGAAVGLPAGALTGRAVWSRVAHAYGIAGDPAWSWPIVVVLALVAVALGNGVAAWPARRAARLQAVDALRSE
jgi:predicted lysophospholipase L1 biosynthesis ABC-type transport system permease subunit